MAVASRVQVSDLPIAGEVEVDEIFTEFSIPVVRALRLPTKLVSRRLSLLDYTTNGNGVSNSFDRYLVRRCELDGQ